MKKQDTTKQLEPRVRNMYTRGPITYAKSGGKNNTIQDDSYTIMEIMERSQKGMPVTDLEKDHEWINSQQFHDLREILRPGFDLTDKQLVRDKLNESQRLVKQATEAAKQAAEATNAPKETPTPSEGTKAQEKGSKGPSEQNTPEQ